MIDDRRRYMLALFLEIPGFLFHYLMIRKLFHIKKSYFAHFILLFVSSLIVCMIIFIGDWYNLPPHIPSLSFGHPVRLYGQPGKKTFPGPDAVQHDFCLEYISRQYSGTL